MKKFLSFAAAAVTFGTALYAMSAPAGADVGAPGVKGTGTAGIVGPLNVQQKLVQFECAAVATVGSASTSVDRCELYADNTFVAPAPDISLSGQAAATAAAAAVPSLTSTLKVCWWVSADPILGERISASGCTTVNTAVLAA
jgi:hypothetical protein